MKKFDVWVQDDRRLQGRTYNLNGYWGHFELNANNFKEVLQHTISNYNLPNNKIIVATLKKYPKINAKCSVKISTDRYTKWYILE